MLRSLLSIVAICEALATLSYTTTPRHVGKNARFLGPVNVAIERAGTTGGGTLYGANFNGDSSANRQDFKGDGSSTDYDSALTYVAFSNYNWLVKVDKSTRTGTASVTAGSKTVTGSSTDFDPELSVGDEILINGETRTVVSIASDTSLTVDEAFVNTATGAAIYLLDAVLRHTTDFTVASNGGLARITLAAAAKAPSGAKIQVHYVTPVSLFAFATATVQFKRFQLPNGYDVVWYASGATTAPSSTNVYLQAIGQ